MQPTISEEQKARDLAIAYATALCIAKDTTDHSTFYQDYKDHYLEFIQLLREES